MARQHDLGAFLEGVGDNARVGRAHDRGAVFDLEAIHEAVIRVVDGALDKAVQLRPEYSDAMAYQNLLLRQKADMADLTARAALEKQADDLLEKAKAIKLKQEEEKAKG